MLATTYALTLDSVETFQVNGSMGKRSPHEATAEASRPTLSLHSRQVQGRVMLSIETLFRETAPHLIGEPSAQARTGQPAALQDATRPIGFLYAKSDYQARHRE